MEQPGGVALPPSWLREQQPEAWACMVEQPDAKRARTDMGSLAEAEILSLVSQRESHRHRQQFSECDAIRDHLRSLGVELFDKHREWRCSDGRKGVLFTAGACESLLQDAEIQARVSEREEARRSKDWERSNVLRDQMRDVGIELDDKNSVWRTLTGREGSYTGVPRAPMLSGLQIQQLICERERLRAAKQFDAADHVRVKLAQHGVEIFDTERLWRSADGQQGVIITGGHEVHCTLADGEIAMRVKQREEARASKRWADADVIRNELRTLGIEFLDKQRAWCTTDGRQGPYPPLQQGAGSVFVGVPFEQQGFHSGQLLHHQPQEQYGQESQVDYSIQAAANTLVAALNGNDAHSKQMAAKAIAELLAKQPPGIMQALQG